MNIFVETNPGTWSGPHDREGLRALVRQGAATPQSLCREGAAGPLRDVAYYIGDRVAVATPPPTVKDAETVRREGWLGLVSVFATLGILGGLGLLGWAAFGMAISADGHYVNQGLMNDRLVILMCGGFLLLAGLVTFAIRSRRA